MAVFAYSGSEEETEALGERLGRLLSEGMVVALTGEVGAGKTCFTRGIARGLGLDPSGISSPTFTLVHEHFNGKLLYHMDLYRVGSLDEAEVGGLTEYFGQDGAISVVEWPDPVEEALPEDAVRVVIGFADADSERKISIELPETIAGRWGA